MHTRLWIMLSAGATLWLGPGAFHARIEAAAGQPRVPASTPVAYRPTVDRYCVSCHSDRLKTGGLSLQTLDMASVGEQNDVWEKVVRKVGPGTMPPLGPPRPDEATIRSFISSLETSLDAAA